MTLPREERLKALGLWPVWRLRGEVGVTALAADSAPLPEIRMPSVAAPDPVESDSLPTVMPLEGFPDPGSGQAVAGMNWDALKHAVDCCTRCVLHASRTRPVFGVGDPQADWLIVGEAPGADEDHQGEPFVGQAGKLLDAMLAAIGLKRGENVYIANVLKSRPPGNRDPRPDEVAACLPYLERQIDLIQPRIILALGRFATQSLLRTESSITNLRGKVLQFHGLPMIVTYHPAYLLRNPIDKAKVWDDLCLARTTFANLPTKD